MRCPNTFVLSTECMTHELNIACVEMSSVNNMFNRCSQIARLLGQDDYQREWMTHCGAVSVANCVLERVSTEQWATQKARSDALIDQIANQSLRRDHMTAGSRHPLVPRPLPQMDLDNAIEAEIAQLKAALMMHPASMSRISHVVSDSMERAIFVLKFAGWRGFGRGGERH